MAEAMKNGSNLATFLVALLSNLILGLNTSVLRPRSAHILCHAKFIDLYVLL